MVGFENPPEERTPVDVPLLVGFCANIPSLRWLVLLIKGSLGDTEAVADTRLDDVAVAILLGGSVNTVEIVEVESESGRLLELE